MSTNDKEHGRYVEKVRGETNAYVQKLLHENHDLRNLVVHLETEVAGLREELAAREARQSELDQKLQEVRAASEMYLTQFAQLEQHNANLANLYVASYQLHGTLERASVIAALQEIIVNLVGSEEFVIVERTEGNEFRVVASIGVGEDAADLHQRDAGVARSTDTGELWVRPGPFDADSLVACIPLTLDGRVTGYIAIYRLLSHKTAFEPLDHELFDLLATHAATALYCTSLAERSRAERPVE